MKDGYNSAQRYYLNIFRDNYRQVLIGENNYTCTLILVSSFTDLMQGTNPFEAFSSLPNSMHELDESHSETPPIDKLATPTREVTYKEYSPERVLDREEVSVLLYVGVHCPYQGILATGYN